MKSVGVHAALLVAALLTAFVTWTGNDEPAPDDASALVWERNPADIASVLYQSKERTVELQRRTTNNQSYIWAKSTGPDPAGAPPPVSGDTTARDTVKPPVRMVTEEFPTGKPTDALFERLAQLRVLRDLGPADAAKRTAYGLTSAESKLTIRFRDRAERVLDIGNTVVGGADRYALDTRANRVYVLGNDLFRSLETGGSDLRLTDFRGFEDNRLATVAVRVAGNQRRMERRSGGMPTGTVQQSVWAAPGSDQPDQAFSNFMEQLNQLWISRYTPNVSIDSLENVLRIDYLDDDGDTLGTLELFRTRGTGTDRVYYMRTRETIVPGEIFAPLGDRIEQDARTLFRASSSQRS